MNFYTALFAAFLSFYFLLLRCLHGVASRITIGEG